MDPTPEAPPTTSAGSILEHDRPCTRCSYSLRGLPLAGACPECGTPVQDSLRGILLQFASAEYLAALGRGLSLVLNGILVMVVAVVLGAVMIGASGRSINAQLGSQAVQLIASGMIIFGYWRYTEPDPGFVGEETPGSARNVIRVTVCISAGAVVVRAACTWLGWPSSGRPVLAGTREMAQVAFLTHTVAWTVQYFAVMQYTRWIARRIPDPYLVKRTKAYAWLLPAMSVLSVIGIVLPIVAMLAFRNALAALVGVSIIAGVSMLVALILYWNLLDRVRKHVKAIRMTGSPAKLLNMLL
jgi:hypothetical protein